MDYFFKMYFLKSGIFQPAILSLPEGNIIVDPLRLRGWRFPLWPKALVAQLTVVLKAAVTRISQLQPQLLPRASQMWGEPKW